MPNVKNDIQAFPATSVIRDCPLAALTSVDFGGPAELLALPASVAELQRLVCRARSRRMPMRVLGRGTNVFAADEGVRGLVVVLRSPGLSRIRVAGTRLTAGAGATLKRVIGTAVGRGLSGLEGLVGIPGSVGGAVVTNAGAAGTEIGHCVSAVTVIDAEGALARLDRSRIAFGYRCSSLGSGVVAEVEFELQPADPVLLRRRANELMRRRRMDQPDGKSAGCVCKNPPGDSAGRLIDRSGLKGTRIGGMEISRRHANFFVNVDGATCDDANRLIEMARNNVMREFGIELELEVDMWTDGGPQVGTL